MSKSKLEKVLEYLINEEHEKAEELFHEVVVEKAREIHESLVSEDEDLDELSEMDFGDEVDEANDEIENEEYYGNDDLGEGDGEEEEMDAADDMADAGADDMAHDGVEGDDMMEPVDGAEGGDDLEAKFAELQAKFDQLADKVDHLESDEEGEGEGEGDMDDTMDTGDDVDADSEDDDMKEMTDWQGQGVYEAEDEDEEEEDMNEEFDLDEDFVDLSESLEDYFHEVKGSVDQEDGVGVGTGGKVNQNRDSVISGKGKRDPMSAEGKTIMSKQKEHGGFEKETAPSSKELGTFINSESKTKRAMVKKEGDASAMLNKSKSDGFGAQNDTSLISGKMAK